MRKTKFRAWDNQDKRMIIDSQDFIPLIITSAGVFRLSALHEENLYHKMEDNRFELMQSTGIKDDNGVEVYQGDKCGDNFIVDWDGSTACFFLRVLEPSPGYGDMWPMDDLGDEVVTGHIYEEENKNEQ